MGFVIHTQRLGPSANTATISIILDYKEKAVSNRCLSCRSIGATDTPVSDLEYAPAPLTLVLFQQ